MRALPALLRSLIAAVLASGCTLLAPDAAEIYGGGGGVAGGGGAASPNACSLTSDSCVVAIHAGLGHTCAVRRADRAVFCWGLDEDGAASGQPGGVIPMPAAVAGLPPARRLATGSAHNCIVSEAEPAELWCWPGESAPGPEEPLRVAGNQPFVDVLAVSVGHLTTSLLTAPGAISTWVPGDPNTQKYPSDVIELHAGTGQSCGRSASGTVACWDFYAGTFPFAPSVVEELGPIALLAGATSGSARLTDVDDPANIEPLAITPHCAWSSAGGLVCFRGQGGPITMRPIDAGAAVVGLAVGMVHGCAVLDDCTVACWGANHAGQLGTGVGFDDGFVDHPLGPVTGLADVAAVTAGAEHSCALGRDGSVWCWGDNGDSQLGVTDVARSDVPAPLDMSRICP
jgi:hypothetical protein